MAGPGRGRWSRRLGKADRAATARAAILRAVGDARASGGAAPTVTDVVSRLGIGRNTFYEHFDDVLAAIGAADAAAAERTSLALEAALGSARTPIEKLRALSRTWIDRAAATPQWTLTGRDLPPLERALRDVLSEARAAGVVGRVPDAARVRCLAGAFAGICLDGPPRSAEDRDDRAEILVDFALRAFR